MQTKRLRNRTYHIDPIDERNYSSEAQQRRRILDKIELLLSEGCSEEVAFSTVEISRATYYRWKKLYRDFGILGLESESRRPHKTRRPKWSKQLVDAIIALRTQYPAWGKSKIVVLLKSDFNIEVTESTVGRIIVHLINKGTIQSVPFYFGQRRPKPRVFDGHAQRWRPDLKPEKPGDLVQVDHMTARTICGKSIKSFRAICPITRFTVEQAYWTATSQNAAEFLDYVRSKKPFPIRSFQVDGGGEFRAYFEQKCAELSIPLYVLPPRSPELNGKVERANGTSKYEFYYQYAGPHALTHLREHLAAYIAVYNTKRPHQALQYLTPLEYWRKLEASQSHM